MQCIYKTISADHFTPVIVFKKLHGIALLESAILEGKSRYSFILLESNGALALTQDGIVETVQGVHTTLSHDAEKFLDLVVERGQKIAVEPLPFPLPARGIGYLSYEFCRFCGPVNMSQKKSDITVPEACFIFGNAFAVFDHYRAELHIAVIGDNAAALENKIAGYLTVLQDNDYRAYVPDQTVYPAQANLDKNRSMFLRGVEEIKKSLASGEIIQGVLSQQLIVSSELPAFEAYCRLRRENPSPYLFYLDFADFQLFGASPEIMVRLSGEEVVIKPIAGTRPRGKTPEEDAALEKELLSDKKELAEHAMLIDLARTDLERIAAPGTVQVPNSFFIEHYSYVMHIVSEVRAQKRSDLGIADIIRNTFPAGTVSGAPRFKAVELVAAQEPVNRGPYGGLIGYFDVNGSFDSCITIRSVLHQNKKFVVQSGAGIVADSVPEKEYLETQNKARATIRALGLSL